MRKEVLYAVIFGIILGGIVLFGINLANNSVNNLPAEENPATGTASPTPPFTKNSLQIISPQNHSVSFEKTITISGKSFPGSTVAIVSESDDLIIESSPEGTFSAQINLISGENTISITAVQSDQSTQTESLSIIQTANLPE